MTALPDKILTYAKHITGQVASGALDPDAAADDIAQMITHALNNDENFENLLAIDPE